MYVFAEKQAYTLALNAFIGMDESAYPCRCCMHLFIAVYSIIFKQTHVNIYIYIKIYIGICKHTNVYTCINIYTYVHSYLCAWLRLKVLHVICSQKLTASDSCGANGKFAGNSMDMYNGNHGIKN